MSSHLPRSQTWQMQSQTRPLPLQTRPPYKPMSTNKNNIHYSASDIEKYRKGELSAGEMHDLEQAALDDPFLADAIDGLSQHPASQQDLTDLRDRLNKKVTEDNRRGVTLLLRRRITLA